MYKSLDALVVVDVEATCWPIGQSPPNDEKSEIIEIGVCLLDLKTLERSAKQSIVVVPRISKVSAFCTELTGLTQDAVDKGLPFPKAVEILQEQYKIAVRPWGSYGAYDRKMFKRDALAHGIPYPFGHTHLNIKTLAAITFGWSKEVGMAQALNKFGLPLEGRHHSGADDSWNIAAILAKIFHQARMGGATA